jgi:sugar O-acyltransferase (sialic acid O-acetyltransferase NeuD family)
MIVAGAGGHAIETLDILIENAETENIFFFDNQMGSMIFQNQFLVLNSVEDLKDYFKKDPHFVLGVGNQTIRKVLYDQFIQAGGIHKTVRGSNSKISHSAQVSEADIFNFCYIGGEARIGRGSLVNTGAQIHHEVNIGDFSVINPAAVLLGACQVGDFCSIGAHATILPGVKIGNRVTIGAGSVVTRDVEDGQTVVGVPGKPVTS